MPTITPELKQLVYDLRERDITIEPVQDRLRLRPREAVDDDLLARVREHKHDLLDLMRGDDDASGCGIETLADDDDSDGIDSASSEATDVNATIARLLAEPRPSFPSPADWTSGRNITPEAVGMERYQRGGRPHALRRDLRKRWLTAYTEAMQVMSEPEAWAKAWKEINQ
ncbi:MAG: hypothetical protein WD534_00990 [Phycisphaeraceae bacterium]